MGAGGGEVVASGLEKEAGGGGGAGGGADYGGEGGGYRGAAGGRVGGRRRIVALPREGRGGGEPMERRHLNDYENLILLCAHHHRVADKQARTHGVEDLRAWKTEHEAWVEAATTVAGAVPWTVV